MAQIAGRLRVSRYKYDRSQEFITGYKFDGEHWCSVALQTTNGAKNLSSYTKFYCEHWSGVRVVLSKGHILRKQVVQKP